MDFHSKKVLITGIDGFTGRPLGQSLGKLGAEVFGLTNNEFAAKSKNIFYAPLQNRDDVADVIKTVKPDYIVHLAGIAFANHKDVLKYYDVNVVGTENLLDACVTANLTPDKIIIASSAAVYGFATDEFVSESSELAPVSHYGVSKLAMEHIAQTYADRLPILITRPFNYVGAEQPVHFLIPKIVDHFKKKSKIIELGNLDIVREFSDFRDVVQTYISLMYNAKPGVVNLCSGKSHSISDVINTLSTISGHKIEINQNPDFMRANDMKRLVGNPKHMNTISKYEYKYSLENTLKNMLDA